MSPYGYATRLVNIILGKQLSTGFLSAHYENAGGRFDYDDYVLRDQPTPEHVGGPMGSPVLAPICKISRTCESFLKLVG